MKSLRTEEQIALALKQADLRTPLMKSAARWACPMQAPIAGARLPRRAPELNSMMPYGDKERMRSVRISSSPQSMVRLQRLSITLMGYPTGKHFKHHARSQTNPGSGAY